MGRLLSTAMTSKRVLDPARQRQALPWRTPRRSLTVHPRSYPQRQRLGTSHDRSTQVFRRVGPSGPAGLIGRLLPLTPPYRRGLRFSIGGVAKALESGCERVAHQ